MHRRGEETSLCEAAHAPPRCRAGMEHLRSFKDVHLKPRPYSDLQPQKCGKFARERLFTPPACAQTRRLYWRVAAAHRGTLGQPDCRLASRRRLLASTDAAFPGGAGRARRRRSLGARWWRRLGLAAMEPGLGRLAPPPRGPRPPARTGFSQIVRPQLNAAPTVFSCCCAASAVAAPHAVAGTAGFDGRPCSPCRGRGAADTTFFGNAPP